MAQDAGAKAPQSNSLLGCGFIASSLLLGASTAVAQVPTTYPIPICSTVPPHPCSIVVITVPQAAAYNEMGRPDAGPLQETCWQRQEAWDRTFGQALTIMFADGNPGTVGFDEADALFGRRTRLQTAMETDASAWRVQGCYSAFGGIAPGVVNSGDVTGYLDDIHDEIAREYRDLATATPTVETAIGDSGDADDSEAELAEETPASSGDAPSAGDGAEGGGGFPGGSNPAPAPGPVVGPGGVGPIID